MPRIIVLPIHGKETKFKDKKSVYNYLDNNQSVVKDLNANYIPNENLKHVKDIYQYVFNSFQPKDGNLDYTQKCTICNQPVKFNLATKRYNRFDKPECVEKYKNEFKQRMNKIHGRDYYTQDTNALKDMLNKRKLTTVYHYKDYQYNVTGKYEQDFLDFMFYILKCSPEDLMECPFTIPYNYDGKERNYIPDFYIPSLNLVVEIKSSLSAYAERDMHMEEAKRLAGEEYMKKKHGYYFYLVDKNYKEFLTYLNHIIDQ